MADKSAKEKLVDFLDRRAFQPVLKADPEDLSEGKRDKLRHAQRATEDARDRYHHYESAEKVYQMYRDDLSSEAAEKVHRELRDLDLPTLHDIRDEFERLADEVGVRG
jgi:hypothetical protein